MSRMTLRNHTPHIAQFVVQSGPQILASIPGIAPGGSIQVPAGTRYEVTASTVFEGNTYSSAPLQRVGATGFLARMRHARGTHELETIEVSSLSPTRLQFHSELPAPVTFTIRIGGRAVQAVVVNSPIRITSVDIGETFSIHAIINGIITETAITTNPSAVITAIADGGHITLDVV